MLGLNTADVPRDHVKSAVKLIPLPLHPSACGDFNTETRDKLPAPSRISFVPQKCLFSIGNLPAGLVTWLLSRDSLWSLSTVSFTQPGSPEPCKLFEWFDVVSASDNHGHIGGSGGISDHSVA